MDALRVQRALGSRAGPRPYVEPDFDWGTFTRSRDANPPVKLFGPVAFPDTGEQSAFTALIPVVLFLIAAFFWGRGLDASMAALTLPYLIPVMLVLVVLLGLTVSFTGRREPLREENRRFLTDKLKEREQHDLKL